MSDQRSTVEVDGDVSRGVAELRRLDTAAAGVEASVAELSRGLAQAEAEAKRLASASTRVGAAQEGLADEAEEHAAAIARGVAQRRAEADALEHEARRLKALGGDQAKILQLQQAATRARLEAAEMAGREGEAAKLARRQELDLTRQIAAEAKQAQAEERDAERQQLAHLRRWEAEEQKILAAERQAAREREVSWTKAEAEARRMSATMAQIEQHARDTAQAMNSWSASASGFGAIGSQIGSVVTGIQSAIALGQQAYHVVDDFAERSLAAQTAAANLQLDIRGARQAFKGYVDDVELARIANMAFEMGVVSTGDELAALAAGVQVKAEKLGVDSTQLFENAVTAVGRGSKLILDNLGIILDQERSLEIYAESLGVATDELTALQEQEAFQKAALILIKKAAEDAGVSVEGFAASWGKAKVEAENFIDRAAGFVDTTGRINEALRELDVEKLENLKFGEMLDRTGSIENIKMFDELTGYLEKWDVSLVDLRMEADRLGISYQQLLTNAIANSELRALDREKKAMEAEKLAQAEAMRAEADEAEHMAELLQVQGIEQEIVNLDLERAIELRREAAELAGDETEALKQTRLLELFRAKADAPKRGGRRKDPNEAIDRERDALLRVLDAREQIIAAEQELIVDTETRAAKQFWLLDLAREELDIREQAAAQRTPRNAEERDNLEAEQLAITTEQRLLDLETQKLVREEERAQFEERIADLDREIERNAALGVSVRLLQQTRDEAALAYAAKFEGEEALRQVQHEQELAAIAADQTDEEARRQKVLADFDAEAELVEARGELYENAASRRIELEALIAAAEGDHDRARQLLHKREVARIKEQLEAQKRALNITRDALGQGMALGETFVNAAIKNDAKREKAALRVRGVEAVARGALEFVEGLAAVARYDIPGAVLHFAASTAGFIQGGMMIAGRVPGQSGGGAGGAGGGAANGGSYGGRHHKVVVNEDSGGGMRDRPSTPASAHTLTQIRGGYTSEPTSQKSGGGDTYINVSNSTLVSGDTGSTFSDLNRQQKKKWGT